MSKNILVLVWVMLGISVGSALLTYWRAASMASPAKVASQGLPALRRGNLIFYGVFNPLLFGLTSYYLYGYLLGHWPATAQAVLLSLAIATGVIFTILAAVVFKMRGFIELLVLHVIYILGFGWLMPWLLAS